jgi:hypothetical protein
MNPLNRFDTPAWWTAAATAVTYGIILLVITVLLFGVPYLVFTSL